MFLLNKTAGPDPLNDFWYNDLGMMTKSGNRVTNELAMSLTIIYSCVKVISESIASMPLHLYEWLDDDTKNRVKKHPLVKLFKNPNKWQTSFEWREMMTSHAVFRGNGYSEIEYAPNGRILQLIPRHPDRVKPVLIDNDGGVQYEITDLTGIKRTVHKSSMFHLRNTCSGVDGYIGLSPIEIERESIGEGIAIQEYGQRYYKNDAQAPGWIEYPAKFINKEARADFVKQWHQNQTGANKFKTPVLEAGMKYHQVGVKHTDAQYLESRKYKDIELCRIYRMQPHKVVILEHATFSNIEHQAIEHVTDTLMPWVVRWEQAISRDLIVDEDKYYAEHVLDSLLRGDAKTRGEMYSSAITTGWMTRNEVRKKENLNSLEGLDEPLEQLNMSSPSDRRNEAIKMKSCERVLNKEMLAIQRSNNNKEKIKDFYLKHDKYVMDILILDQETASKYIEVSLNEVLTAIDQKKTTEMLNEWKESRAKLIYQLRSKDEISSNN